MARFRNSESAVYGDRHGCSSGMASAECTRLLRPWKRPVVIVVLIATEMSRAATLLRHRAVRYQRACHSVQRRRECALHFIRHSITGHQLQEQIPHVFQRANRTDREAVAILSLQLHELGVGQVVNTWHVRFPAPICWLAQLRIQGVFDHVIKIDDDGRFKDKGNVAAGLLNRLPTGMPPEVQHMRAAQWREMPALYATLCATDGMPTKALRVLIFCGAPRAHEVFRMR